MPLLLHAFAKANRLYWGLASHRSPSEFAVGIFCPIGPPSGGFPLNKEIPMRSGSVLFNLKRYCEVAGIPPERRLCTHGLRHTLSRLWYGAGQDILSLSKHLRHSSLQVTSGYLSGLVGTSDPGAALLSSKFAGV